MYIRAIAILPNNIYYDRFIGTEEFNIMLQSSFVYIGDKYEDDEEHGEINQCKV